MRVRISILTIKKISGPMRGRFVKSNALNSNMPLEAGQVQINIYTLLASKISLQWPDIILDMRIHILTLTNLHLNIGHT